MKLASISFAFCALAVVTFSIGCDAVKPKAPKQVQDTDYQAPKYGNTQVDKLEVDAGQ